MCIYCKKIPNTGFKFLNKIFFLHWIGKVRYGTCPDYENDLYIEMLNNYKTDKKLLVSILVQTCIRECHWYMPPFIHGDIQNKNKKVINSIYKTFSGYRGRPVGWGAFFLNSFNNNQSLFSYLFLIIATAVAVLVGQYKSYLPVTCEWNQFQSLVLCSVQSTGIIAGFVWNK